MKKFIPLFALLLSAWLNSTVAQSDYQGFNLKDYYTPDIVKNALELNVYLRGNSNNSSSKLNANNTSEGHGTEFNIDNTYINFSNLINTRKLISTIGFGFNPSLNYHKYSNGDTTFTFTHSESAYWNNRSYYNTKNFIIYNASVSLQGGYSNFPSKLISKNQRINFTPSVGWGMGRIENVTDARQAIYILEECKKNGVLSRDMTKEEIFEFAQLISTVKNKRFLDSRLHRIDEITTIDNYLKKKDVLSDRGAAYFTSLYDMWDYGDLFTRNSGATLIFDIAPSVRYLWDYDKNSGSQSADEMQSISYGAVGHIGYNYSKPIKLNWQHDASANLYFNIDNQKDLINTHIYTSYTPFANLRYRLGYYPSTRTNVFAQAEYATSYSKFKNGSDYSLFNRVSVEGGVNYYASQNLRLTANLGVTNDNNKIQGINNLYKSTNNNLRVYSGVSLSYLFF